MRGEMREPDAQVAGQAGGRKAVLGPLPVVKMEVGIRGPPAKAAKG